MKKSIICLTMMLALCAVSLCSFATTSYSDINGHWAESAIERWEEEGALNSFTGSEYKPDAYATRADFVEMIVSLLKLEEKADISAYKDISKTSPHYDAMAKAVAAGLIKGYSDTELRPESSISREEFIVILNRVYKMSTSSNKSVDKFTDASKVSSWAMDSVNAFIENGYLNGYPDLSIRPDSYITRAEVSQLLNKSIGIIIRKPGEYDVSDVKGNIIVLSKDVKLKKASNVDNICVLDSKVKNDLKVDGDSKVVPVLIVDKETSGNSSKGSSSSSGGTSGSVSAGSSSTPLSVISISKGEQKYTVTKTGNTIKNGAKLTVKVDGEEIVKSYLLNKNEDLNAQIINVFNAMTENDDEIELAIKTLSENYSDNLYVKNWGTKIFAKLSLEQQSIVKNAVTDNGNQISIEIIYNALVKDNKCTPSDICSKALETLKEVIPGYDDAITFLNTL